MPRSTGRRRNVGIRPPRTGVTESLASLPSVAVRRTRTPNYVGAINRLLGAAGQAATATAKAVAEDKIARDMDELVEAETHDLPAPEFRTAEVHNLYYRDMAYKAYLDFDPTAVEIGDDETIGQAMGRYIAETYGSEPDAFKYAFARFAGPALAQYHKAVVLQQRQELVKDGFEQSVTQIIHNFGTDNATLAGDWTTRVKLAAAAGWTQDKIDAQALRAARGLALAGNPDGVQWVASKLLDGRQADEIAKITEDAKLTAGKIASADYMALLTTFDDDTILATGRALRSQVDHMRDTKELPNADQYVDLVNKVETLVFHTVNKRRAEQRDAWKRDLENHIRPAADILTEAHAATMREPDNYDPQYQPPDALEELMNRAGRVRQLDVRRARVRARFAPVTTDDKGLPAPLRDAPLGPADDAALTLELGTMLPNAIQVAQQGDSGVVLSISDPLAVAKACAVAGRVPQQLRHYIAGNAVSDSADQVAQAATFYLLLRQTNERVATQVYDGLGTLGKVRLSAIGSAVMAPGADLEKVREYVASEVPKVMRFDASQANYTSKQISKILWGDDEKVVPELEAAELIRDAIGDAMGDIDEVPYPVTNALLAELADRVPVERALDLTESEDGIAARAKDFAVRATLYKHPPTVWNGRTIFPGGHMPPGFRLDDAFRRDLTHRTYNGVPCTLDGREPVDDIIATHRPVWTTEFGRPGYILVDAQGLPYTQRWRNPATGETEERPWVLDPFAPPKDVETPAKIVERIKRIWEMITPAEQERRAREIEREARRQRAATIRPLELDIYMEGGGP